MLVQGLGRGQRPVGMLRRKASQELGGPPSGSLAAQFEGRLEDVVGRRVGTRVRPMRAIEQPVRALVGSVALEPLIARRAADAVAPAELGVREQAAFGLEDESLAFGHGIGLLPWHRRLPKSV